MEIICDVGYACTIDMGIFSYSSCTLGTTFPGMALKMWGPTTSFLTPSTSTFVDGWYATPHPLISIFTAPASLYPSTNIVTTPRLL